MTAAGKARMVEQLRAQLYASSAFVSLTLPGGGAVYANRLALRQRDMPRLGGTEQEYRTSFRAVYDDCPELHPGDLVEADGAVWRVLIAEPDPAHVGLLVHCGERYANG